MMNWRFINTWKKPGNWNMAVDEALFELAQPEPVLRLYGWNPATLSLGYFQKYEDFFPEPARSLDVPIIRRSTGGGAILHEDELTYSVILTKEQWPDEFNSETIYRKFHNIIEAALADVGIKASERGEAKLESDFGPEKYCFAKSASLDVAAGTRKIAGSAQRKKGNRLLMHGSIFLGKNRMVPLSASASEMAGRKVKFEEFAGLFKTQAEKLLDVSFDEIPLSPEELLNTEKICVEKFSSDNWNKKR